MLGETEGITTAGKMLGIWAAVYTPQQVAGADPLVMSGDRSPEPENFSLDVQNLHIVSVRHNVVSTRRMLESCVTSSLSAS